MNGREWTSLLGALCATVAFAGDTSIFLDDFEPNLCSWSSIATDCQSEAETEAQFVGLTADFCIPRSSGLLADLIPYDACKGSLCPDGQTEGCTVSVTIEAATADFELSTVDLTVTAEDVSLPIEIVYLGTHNCLIDVTNASSEVQVIANTESCTPPYLFVSGLTSVAATSSADFAASGCAISGTINSVLPTYESTLISAIDDAIETVVSDLGAEMLVGRLLCAP